MFVRHRMLLTRTLWFACAMLLSACGQSGPAVDAQATADTIIGNANATATAITTSAQKPSTPSVTSAVAISAPTFSPATLTAVSAARVNPTSTTFQISGGGPQGYILTGDLPDDDFGIWFIQWTDIGGKLSGQLTTYTVKVSNTAPPQYNTGGNGFTGTRNGSTVTLTFARFGTQTITGTISGNKLTLLIPNSRTGQFTPFVLQQANTQDYNNAVTSLQQQIAAGINARNRPLAGTWYAQDRDSFLASNGLVSIQFTAEGQFTTPSASGTYEVTKYFQNYKGPGKDCGEIAFHPTQGRHYPPNIDYCVDTDKLTFQNSSVYTRNALPPPTATPPLNGRKFVVVNTGGDNVNLRAEPNASAGVVAKLTEGDRVEQLGPDRLGDGRNWRNVRTANGIEGWIDAVFLAEFP